MRTFLIVLMMVAGVSVGGVAQTGTGSSGGADASGASGSGKADPDAELDRILRRALESSPEILLAKAKLREAEASLLAAKLKVTEDIIEFVHERRLLTKQLDAGRRRLAELHTLHRSGRIPASDLADAENRHIELKAAQARVAARSRMLGLDAAPDAGGGARGITWRENIAVDAAGTSGGAVRTVQRTSKAHATIMKTLEKQVAVTLTGDLTSAVTQIMGKKSKVKVVYDQVYDKRFVAKVPVIGELYLRGTRLDALTAVADLTHCVFVLRPYGLFVTTAERSKSYRGDKIPRDHR